MMNCFDKAKFVKVVDMAAKRHLNEARKLSKVAIILISFVVVIIIIEVSRFHLRELRAYL